VPPPDAQKAGETLSIAMELGKLIGDRLSIEIRESERRINDRVDLNHRETMKKIDEMKTEIGKVNVEVARIDTRLNEGDRRFSELEERVDELEKQERTNAISYAQILGASGAGAALTELGRRIFGG